MQVGSLGWEDPLEEGAFEWRRAHRVRPECNFMVVSGWFQITGCYPKPFGQLILTLVLKTFLNVFLHLNT